MSDSEKFYYKAEEESVLESAPIEEEAVVEKEEELAVPSKPKAKAKRDTHPVATQLNVDGLSVSQEKIVFESLFERNSRTVGLIQIRLIELGYMSAGGDKRGWFSAGTKEALDNFMKDNGLSGGYSDRETLDSLFSGTKVEIVV